MICAQIPNTAARCRGSDPATHRRLVVVAVAHAFIGTATLLAPVLGAPPGADVHACWLFSSVLACVLPLASRHVVQRIPSEPVLTLIAAYCVYFVVGAAVPLAGDRNPELRDLMEQFGASWDVVLEVDSMNSIGLAVALGAFVVLPSRWATAVANRGAALAGGIGHTSVAAAFMILGAAVYLPLLAVLASGSGADAIPGGQLLWRFGALMDCGILLAIIAPRSGAMLPCMAVVLAVAQAFMGLMAANKSEALTPVATLLVAWVIRQPKPVQLVLAVAIAVSGYLLATGITGPMRSSPQSSVTGLSGRVSLAMTAIDEARPGEESSVGWTALNRLCYLPAQARSIALHRAGDGDAYLWTAPWLVVPRALYPDKPNLSERGARVAEQFSGQWGSSASPTVFVDGYYQLGWPGVLLAGMTVGWVVSVFGAVSRVWLQRRAYLFLPLVLYGHFIAFRIDGVALGAGDHLFGIVLVGMLAFACLLVGRTSPILGRASGSTVPDPPGSLRSATESAGNP